MLGNYKVGDIVTRKPEFGLFRNKIWYDLQGSVKVPKLLVAYRIEEDTVWVKNAVTGEDLGSWDTVRFDLHCDTSIESFL